VGILITSLAFGSADMLRNLLRIHPSGQVAALYMGLSGWLGGAALVPAWVHTVFCI
jgi:hypothetical protein